ncbi:MAG TPA: alpha/beta hydrolase [Anaerolineaceae bacterium]|nr:alpha/beta hydrolase [Anaerolineaceae bacterium]
MIAHLDDIDKFYEIRGSGKPIYLMHGLALDHSIWLEMADYYADQAQFIIPDLRGHGCTPLGNADASLEQLANDVIQLADSLGHQKFILAGHSLGGYIALALAEAHADRLAGLVTVTSHARADSPDKLESRFEQIRQARLEGIKSMSDNLIERMMPEGESAQPDEHMCEVVSNSSAEGFANVQLAMAKRPDRLLMLRSLSCPVLAIAGGKDRILPKEIAFQVAENARQGRVVCLPEVGHLPMLEVPYTLGALLVSM